jgi:hypothetical protein
MIEFVLSLPTWFGCALSMIATALVSLLVYLVSYRLTSKYQSDSMTDPTSSLFRVVGLLLSLMLSLGFTKVLSEQKDIRTAIVREAVAISDIFDVLELFDSERTREIRIMLVEYAQAVINDDWPALANDRLGQQASHIKRQLAKKLLDLKPATPAQEELLPMLLADIDALSDHRSTRLDTALEEPPFFVFVLIFGILVTMACFGAYRPQAPLIVLVLIATLFVGLVMFLIVKLSDPFQGDIRIEPTVFEHLVETLQSRLK